MKLFNIFLFFYLVIISGCNHKKTSKSNIQKNNSVDFAQNFTINKKGDLTFISIINPDSKSIDKTFTIKSNRPNLIWIGNKKYNTNSIISFSSTFIGLLDKLNELKRIKGIDDRKFVHNQMIKKQIFQKKIIELKSIELATIEKMATTHTEIILYSGFGTPFPNEKKLNMLNIISLPIYDWKETHPLGKAEWIKIFGILTNKEQAANIYFENLKNRYLSIKQKNRKLTLSKKLFSGSLVGDYWYLPAGESYMANIFKDAKIDYVEKSSKGIGSISKSLEYCLHNYKNAKFWINPGVSNTSDLIRQNKHYKHFNAIKNNTFCYSHNPNLFWEKSAIEPDSLLLDLIQISHPELHLKRNLYFYKKLN